MSCCGFRRLTLMCQHAACLVDSLHCPSLVQFTGKVQHRCRPGLHSGLQSGHDWRRRSAASGRNKPAAFLASHVISRRFNLLFWEPAERDSGVLICRTLHRQQAPQNTEAASGSSVEKHVSTTFCPLLSFSVSLFQEKKPQRGATRLPQQNTQHKSQQSRTLHSPPDTRLHHRHAASP